MLPDHLAAILDFAERGLLLQESFSLKATIELIVCPFTRSGEVGD